MNDQAIIHKFWDRNEDAINDSKKQYEDYCLYIANNVLHDRLDAEEVFNDALLAAWDSIPPQRPEKLAAYLARITRNLALRRKRDNGRLRRGGEQADLAFEELDECLPGGKDVERELERSELRAAIKRFLRTLPRTERRLFLCRYWYFDSIAELSRSFGFSESKVKSILWRCRNKLRRRLEKEGYT